MPQMEGASIPVEGAVCSRCGGPLFLRLAATRIVGLSVQSDFRLWCAKCGTERPAVGPSETKGRQ
jgi:hypothetical protein